MTHQNDRILHDILADHGIEDQFPGLRDVLTGDRDNHRRRRPVPSPPGFAPGPPESVQSPEDFVRGILTSIQTHKEFQEARNQLTEAERGQLDEFLAGKPIKDILQPHQKQDGSVQLEEPRFDLPVSPASRRHFEALQDATLRTPQQALTLEGKDIDVQVHSLNIIARV